MEITELERRALRRPSNEISNQITRECLFEALLILMKKKPFDKITVSELVARAGVSRTSFYRNYRSIEQIITDPLRVIVHTLRKTIREEKYKDNMKAWYFDMFHYLRDNYAHMLEILLIATDANFLQMKAIGDVFTLPENTPEALLKYTAFNGAIKDILAEWVRGGCQDNIEFLSDLCVKLQTTLLS